MHLWFFPWANFGKTIKVGEIEFFDFFVDGELRYSKLQREILTDFFCNVYDENGLPVKSVFIAENANASKVKGHDWNNRVRWAIKALCFCCTIGGIIERLTGDQAEGTRPCTERYQSFCVAFHDGQVFHSELSNCGFSDLSKSPRKYFPPTRMPEQCDVNATYLSALGRLNDNYLNSELWSQLDVCMEWFKNAYAISSDVSEPVKYVSLMTAFESLTRKRNRDDAFELGNKLIEICGWENLPKTESSKNNKKQVELNKAQKFIIEYAGYRNKFVHGSKLPWGYVKHCVGDAQYDVKFVMALLIFCAIGKMLKSEKITDENEILNFEQSVSLIIKLLKWDTLELCVASPHIDYLERVKVCEEQLTSTS